MIKRISSGPGRILKNDIILYKEISIDNTNNTININKTNLCFQNETEVNIRVSKPDHQGGNKNLKNDQEESKKETELKSLKMNIALTSLVVFSHLFILFLVFFLIFKSNKEAERRLRIMLKYKPTKNWIEPLE